MYEMYFSRQLPFTSNSKHFSTLIVVADAAVQLVLHASSSQRTRFANTSFGQCGTAAITHPTKHVKANLLVSIL